MTKSRISVALLIVLMLSVAVVRGTRAEDSDSLQTFFSKEYASISIRVDATNETDPGGSIAIKLLVDCWALNVTMDSLNITVYGFTSGRQKTLLQNVTLITASTPLVFNSTREYDCAVPVPSDVWDATYATLNFRGTYTRTSEDFKGSEGFSLTIIRNVYLASLERQLKNLTNDYRALNNTYWQLNGTYTQLNATYWGLRQEFNASRARATDLDNTRQAAVILAITTIFFVASTIYLVLRRPKEHW
jgi:hypothetical protein